MSECAWFFSSSVLAYIPERRFRWLAEEGKNPKNHSGLLDDYSSDCSREKRKVERERYIERAHIYKNQSKVG